VPAIDAGARVAFLILFAGGNVNRLRLLLGVCLVLLPLAASAHEARTLKWVNLRAGPAREFPLLARLAPATRVTVESCTPRSDWCQVVAPGSRRGWVYAPNLSYPQEHAQGRAPGRPDPVAAAVAAVHRSGVRGPRVRFAVVASMLINVTEGERRTT